MINQLTDSPRASGHGRQHGACSSWRADWHVGEPWVRQHGGGQADRTNWDAGQEESRCSVEGSLVRNSRQSKGWNVHGTAVQGLQRRPHHKQLLLAAQHDHALTPALSCCRLPPLPHFVCAARNTAETCDCRG